MGIGQVDHDLLPAGEINGPALCLNSAVLVGFYAMASVHLPPRGTVRVVALEGQKRSLWTVV